MLPLHGWRHRRVVTTLIGAGIGTWLFTLCDLWLKRLVY